MPTRRCTPRPDRQTPASEASLPALLDAGSALAMIVYASRPERRGIG